MQNLATFYPTFLARSARPASTAPIPARFLRWARPADTLFWLVWNLVEVSNCRESRVTLIINAGGGVSTYSDWLVEIDPTRKREREIWFNEDIKRNDGRDDSRHLFCKFECEVGCRIREAVVLQRVFRVRICRLEKIQEFFLECFQHFLQRFNSFVNYTHRLTGINPLNDCVFCSLLRFYWIFLVILYARGPYR